MKTTVVYCCVSQGPKSYHLAYRFVSSWQDHPPGQKVDLVIACNGGPLAADLGEVFAPLKPQFYPRLNDAGFDLSAYQDVAGIAQCEALLCCGESVYFHRGNWLLPLVEAWHRYGPGMYGPFASNLIRPHLGTTCFLTDPNLLRASPKVTNHEERYQFEHGHHSFWKRVQSLGRPVKLVTFRGVYDQQFWRTPPNAMWRGDQSDCLVWCSHTDNFRDAKEQTKRLWERNAEGVAS